MFVKLLRSVAIGLIVGAILLVAMPSLRSLNPLSTPQFDSTDETPASYNLAVRRAAPAVVNVYNRGLNTNSHNQLEIRTQPSADVMAGAGINFRGDGGALVIRVPQAPCSICRYSP